MSQRLEKIPGVGPLTATALAASIADAQSFKDGRQLAAWLGLVPRQHSSGGKPTLLGINQVRRPQPGLIQLWRPAAGILVCRAVGHGHTVDPMGRIRPRQRVPTASGSPRLRVLHE
ncbi:hypothetical protein CEW83_12305 [Parazoarcus communis]|uniref:Transposase IS116/IS110/IS902 C-terminal domain-containing protein n=1 Tax=Parazoarcus communis TaxID=41977 RepID=A0A2U8GRS9_9RHOO|nr:hypothetical protein CEW83_12305 [Parazoarcus communis]